MLRFASVVVVAFGVTAAPRAASAGGPEAWLQWSSTPQACGDARSFAARVESRLGRSPAAAAASAHVNVAAHIGMATAGGVSRWVGEVRLRGDDKRTLGSRTLERRDASCQPLVDALALVAALALSDDARSEDDGSERATDRPAPGTEVAHPEPLRPRAPPALAVHASDASAHPAAPRRSVGLDVGAQTGVGLLPRLALGVEVSAFVRFVGGTRALLAVDGWQRQTSVDALGQGASFQRLAVGLGLCPLEARWRGWTGSTCVRGQVGRLRVSGVGLATASTQSRLTVDGGAGVEVARALTGTLTFGLGVTVVAPAIRDRIAYAGTGGSVEGIFRPAPVAGIGEIRLSYGF